MMTTTIYEPAEDSYLLQKWVTQYATGRVLDVGTGSGIQALTAIRRPDVREVVAVDVDRETVAQLQEKVKRERIRKLTVLQSDLLENVQGHFNLIIFNPPYLPQDIGVEDAAIYGGKKGWEIVERFLDQVSSHLFPEGKVLLLFSSLTNKEKVEELLQHRLFQFTLLESQKLPFETLYVYEVSRSSLLRELERQGVRSICYFARGKRGLVYRGVLDAQVRVKSHFSVKKLIPVAIKVERADSKAEVRVANEAKWLQIVNQVGVGPRFLLSEQNSERDYVVYEFVDGMEIEAWLAQAEKDMIVSVLGEVLEQCARLDELGVTKDEMHRPLKHILVTSKNRPVLIDFERCISTERPKNVTQFVEYIARISAELSKKGLSVDPVQLRSAAHAYRRQVQASTSGARLTIDSRTINYIKSLLRGRDREESKS